jgi:hypothetical protein
MPFAAHGFCRCTAASRDQQEKYSTAQRSYSCKRNFLPSSPMYTYLQEVPQQADANHTVAAAHAALQTIIQQTQVVSCSDGQSEGSRSWPAFATVAVLLLHVVVPIVHALWLGWAG